MRLIIGIRGKYPQTNAELQKLQKEGIIIDRHIGRMREIRINKEKPSDCNYSSSVKDTS